MMVDLAGTWSLADDAGGHACNMTLPGDGISALHDAGLIPDPYWGRNEYGLRWISERDWTATQQFDLTHTDVDLVLSMVDTVVTVRVNDSVVLTAQNSFCSYRGAKRNVISAGIGTSRWRHSGFMAICILLTQMPRGSMTYWCNKTTATVVCAIWPW